MKIGILRLAPPVIGALALSFLTSAAAGQGLEREYATPAAGTSTQRFGASLALDGDVMVAGAPYEDTNGANAGAVFVFRWDAASAAWIEEQQLFPSDPEASSRFGTAVAIDDDVIAVGVPLEDNAGGSDAGAVYLFRFDPVAMTWSEEQKIIEGGGWYGNQFGMSVGLSGTGLIIGAIGCDGSFGADYGCAYIYRWKSSSGSWLVEQMLTDPSASPNDHAGTAVAIEDDLVLIASPFSNEAGVKDAGAVNVWRNYGGSWSHSQKLTSSHKSRNDQFGLNVALRNEVVMVGAPLEDDNPSVTDSGAAYLFRFDGTRYVEEMRFTHPTPASSMRFGSDVDVFGDVVLVGAVNDDTVATDAGCAYTFRFGRRAWWFDQPLAASDGAASDHLGAQVALSDSQMLVAADGNDTASGTDWGVVYGYPAPEITLEITPTSPPPDAPVTLSAFYGTPGDPVLTVIVELNGSPLFFPILADVFAADHAWTFTANAPNPSFGLHLGFRSFKISETGPVVFSEIAYVDV